MKVIAINGITKSGKTTVCEKVIAGLTSRGYTVGSVKEIHFEQFKIDPNESTNTNRHKKAGSKLVTARGMYETDILYQEMLPIDEILRHYNYDYVILEGVTDCNVPRIITAHNEAEVLERIDCRAVAVSGVIANSGVKEIEGLPVIHTFEETEKLVDFVEKTAFEPLPNFDFECCGKCGYTCRELTGLIAKGKKTHSDCVLNQAKITLKINGNEIPMVPFVQNILKNSVMGVVSELNGFDKNSEIEVKFKVE